MSDNAYSDRRRLNFSQAEGVEPLPIQLQTKELSQRLRARLWLVIYESIEKDIGRSSMGGRSYLNEGWKNILYDFHTLHENLMADEFENDANKLIQPIKQLFENAEYYKVFEFIQLILRHKKCTFNFEREIAWALKTGNAAYRILDTTTIIPIGSEAEFETLQRAFADLAMTEFQGARSHLRSAGAHLTAGDYASSVRESVHSVESVARTLAPLGQLNDALAALEKSTRIHGALKRGFGAIYGYTSDEKGIRHPLLDDPKANVDEIDALFMIGACAAFVSYMINKACLAGLLNRR